MSIEEEVCIAIAGNADSGKSSFIGVMVYNELDDGNGLARSKVCKHPHELSSGRTSDITIKTLKVSETKEIVFADLPGHQPYLKTALYGITGYYPDYGIVIIAANRGILPMTQEHLRIFLHLKIPFIVVITRSDNAPVHIYKETVKSLQSGFKKINKKLVSINSLGENETQESSDLSNEIIQSFTCNPDLIPLITVSNKTGYFINTARSMIKNLKSRKEWYSDSEAIFYIDSKFNPKGIGLVISGICKGRPIKVGDKMYIGPYNNDFVLVKVWSIHDNNKNIISSLMNGTHGCLAIHIIDKKTDFNKNKIRKGMILYTKKIYENICYRFDARIKVLNHATTISDNYSPVVHCGTVRQTARICIDKDKHLRIGDEDIVQFRFIFRSEFIEPNSTLFFREGTTRGIGTVLKVLSVREDNDAAPVIKKKSNNNRNEIKK